MGIKFLCVFLLLSAGARAMELVRAGEAVQDVGWSMVRPEEAPEDDEGYVVCADVAVVPAVPKDVHSPEEIQECVCRVQHKRVPLDLAHYDLESVAPTVLPSGAAWLSGLTALRLGYNNLTEVPAGISSLPRLRELLLQENNITHVSEELRRCSGLVTLWLFANPLDQEQMIPSDAWGLPKLADLTLSEDQFAKNPEWSVRLAKLRSIRPEILRVALLDAHGVRQAACFEVVMRMIES